jgi:hypothetical protein
MRLFYHGISSACFACTIHNRFAVVDDSRVGDPYYIDDHDHN